MCHINRLTLIEKIINFSITGENSNGAFEIKITSFMNLTRHPETVICVGRVKKGQVKKGDLLEISFLDNSLLIDEISNIQLNKKDIPVALTGQSIGIKFTKTTYETLRAVNSACNK